jgi:hypothetical protein
MFAHRNRRAFLDVLNYHLFREYPAPLNWRVSLLASYLGILSVFPMTPANSLRELWNSVALFKQMHAVPLPM